MLGSYAMCILLFGDGETPPDSIHYRRPGLDSGNKFAFNRTKESESSQELSRQASLSGRASRVGIGRGRVVKIGLQTVDPDDRPSLSMKVFILRGILGSVHDQFS